DHARTGDAMLQLYAMSVAWSSWSGLLQDHAKHARGYRSARISSQHLLSATGVWRSAGISHLSRYLVICGADHRAFPRSAKLFTTRFASSYLICPPVGSRL